MAIQSLSSHQLVKIVFIVAIIHVAVSVLGSICNTPVLNNYTSSICNPTINSNPIVFWGISILACIVLTIFSGILLFDHFKEEPQDDKTKQKVTALFSLSVIHLIVSFVAVGCARSNLSSGSPCDILVRLGWFVSLAVTIVLVVLSKQVLDVV